MLLARAVRSLARFGRLTIVDAAGRRHVFEGAAGPIVSVRFHDPALPWKLLSAAQADISKWAAAGKRLHNIAGQYSLSETAEAHLAVEQGGKLGTVIVDCAR